MCKFVFLILAQWWTYGTLGSPFSFGCFVLILSGSAEVKIISSRLKRVKFYLFIISQTIFSLDFTIREMRVTLEPATTTGFEFASTSRGVSFCSQLAPAKVQTAVVPSGFSPVRGNWLESTPFETARTTPSALECDHHKSCAVISPHEWNRVSSYSQTLYLQTDSIHRNPNYGER